MQAPLISKYPVKLLPIGHMLLRCHDIFGPMLRGGPKFVIEHTDFSNEVDRPPTAITLTVVTPSQPFDFRYISDWLHENYARGGTLAELCAWVEQHRDRVAQFTSVIAPGTILEDGVKHRTRMQLMPFVDHRAEFDYLEIRPVGATWRNNSSFLAVLDADNPPSS